MHRQIYTMCVCVTIFIYKESEGEKERNTWTNTRNIFKNAKVHHALRIFLKIAGMNTDLSQTYERMKLTLLFFTHK